jgi:hypothetical protein
VSAKTRRECEHRVRDDVDVDADTDPSPALREGGSGVPDGAPVP